MINIEEVDEIKSASNQLKVDLDNLLNSNSDSKSDYFVSVILSLEKCTEYFARWSDGTSDSIEETHIQKRLIELVNNCLPLPFEESNRVVLSILHNVVLLSSMLYDSNKSSQTKEESTRDHLLSSLYDYLEDCITTLLHNQDLINLENIHRQDWKSNSPYQRNRRVTPGMITYFTTIREYIAISRHLSSQLYAKYFDNNEFTFGGRKRDVKSRYCKSLLLHYLSIVTQTAASILQIYFLLNVSRVRSVQWQTDLHFALYAISDTLCFIACDPLLVNDLLKCDFDVEIVASVHRLMNTIVLFLLITYITSTNCIGEVIHDIKTYFIHKEGNTPVHKQPMIVNTAEEKTHEGDKVFMIFKEMIDFLSSIFKSTSYEALLFLKEYPLQENNHMNVPSSSHFYIDINEALVKFRTRSTKGTLISHDLMLDCSGLAALRREYHFLSEEEKNLFINELTKKNTQGNASSIRGSNRASPQKMNHNKDAENTPTTQSNTILETKENNKPPTSDIPTSEQSTNAEQQSNAIERSQQYQNIHSMISQSSTQVTLLKYCNAFNTLLMKRLTTFCSPYEKLQRSLFNHDQHPSSAKLGKSWEFLTIPSIDDLIIFFHHQILPLNKTSRKTSISTQSTNKHYETDHYQTPHKVDSKRFSEANQVELQPRERKLSQEGHEEQHRIHHIESETLESHRQLPYDVEVLRAWQLEFFECVFSKRVERIPGEFPVLTEQQRSLSHSISEFFVDIKKLV